MEKTMVELFAGVGGFRLGLEPFNWKTVFANQWEPSTKTQHAFEVYIANFGSENASNEDINKVNIQDEIPEHTLLVGGFPCQDYSVARTQAEGIQGKKGVLWWRIAKVLELKRPEFVLLENVDRLIKSPAKQRGRDFGVMLRTLLDYGYAVEWRVINAAEYGFAQRRRRVFIFAAHESTNYYKSIKQLNHLDIIYHNGFFQDQFKLEWPTEKVPKYINISKDCFEDLVAISDNFNFLFENTGIMIDGEITSIKTTPVYHEPIPLGKILIENADSSLYIDYDEDKLKKFKRLKGAKKLKRVSANGFEYFYSEGGMSFPDPLDRPARTMLTSEGTLNRSTHVIEDPYTKRLRLLSPVECERLNEFPDNWTNPENCKIEISNSRRYFFMGNALVVGLIKKMGKTLDKIIEQED